MRRQYHFWVGEHGLDVWDVDGLIRLSSGFPVEQVSPDAIAEIDSIYWFNDDRESATVRRVVDHVRLIPDDRVMDGMHRIARCLLEGFSTIGAVRFEVLPEPDYRNCRPEDLPY